MIFLVLLRSKPWSRVREIGLPLAECSLHLAGLSIHRAYIRPRSIPGSRFAPSTCASHVVHIALLGQQHPINPVRLAAGRSFLRFSRVHLPRRRFESAEDHLRRGGPQRAALVFAVSLFDVEAGVEVEEAQLAGVVDVAREAAEGWASSTTLL
jgi:hypothetical protein